MAKKFAELRAQMSPEALALANEKAKAMLAEMPLNELRQARGLSQKMLAEVLHVQQPSIAKIEKRTDMYISTLRSHIESMCGPLEVGGEIQAPIDQGDSARLANRHLHSIIFTAGADRAVECDVEGDLVGHGVTVER